MSNVSEQFVDRLYLLTTGSIPEKVIAKSRQCFLDYISVAIAGSEMYKSRNSVFLKENQFSGQSSIIGMHEETDLHSAVLINAFNAHVLELDDSHREAMTHLGAPIFSALLNVAEIHGISLDNVLKGAVIGYEAAIRLANAIQPSHKKRGFHVSGTCCTVGSAMGIAAMMGYSKEEMMNVLSASATSAAGLLAVVSGRSEQKPYNIANAAVSGVDAALYGRCFIGAEDILGDSRGYLKAVCDQFNIEKLYEEGYAIESIYQKLYAACRHCHAPMEAMLKIRKDHGLSLDEIENIYVYTYDLAINGHDHTVISGISSAKQSIPYGVAVAFVCGDCGVNAFTQRKVNNHQIVELTKKVSIIEDKELTSLVPAKRAAIVEVVLKNGRKFRQRVDYAKGEPENPITDLEFKEKFYSLSADAGMNKEKSDAVLDFIQNRSNEPSKRLFQWI